MKRINKLSLICILLLYFSISLALPSDNQLPANIQSESALLNFKKNRSVFNKNVIVTQGSTKLTANKLETFSNQQKKLVEVIAYGNPAHYQTIPNDGDKIFYASANKIIYHALTGNIILIGNGKFKQDNNIFNAPYISYNRNTGVVTSKSIKNKHTTIIIQPSTMTKASSSPHSPPTTPSKKSKL